MTCSIRVVCTGSTEGDEIVIHAGHGKATQVSRLGGLARGEVSQTLSAGPGEAHALWLCIEGTHGDGPYRGALDVFAAERPSKLPPDDSPKTPARVQRALESA